MEPVRKGKAVITLDQTIEETYITWGEKRNTESAVMEQTPPLLSLICVKKAFDGSYLVGGMVRL